MLNYDSPQDLRRYLEENGLGMQKKFGQNFLINADMREKLVTALNAPEAALIWETGPGLGAMTSALLNRGLQVRAFEIDHGFSRALESFFGDNPQFSLVKGDVLKTWPKEPKDQWPRYFLGNLPYNIAATLIAGYIEGGLVFDRCVITVQKEVATRFAAKPGSKDYSSLSVLCSLVYDVKQLFILKPQCFYPSPNIDSSAVLLSRKAGSDTALVNPFLVTVIRTLFSSRRKTIKNNIIRVPGVIARGEDLEALLRSADVDPMARAETLSGADFLRLEKVLREAQA